ncbi:hypothetical protein N7495_003984 [Penicillium taxi]|uniref:uncharacterized protein n=1 Tax=Penicillium taxi TaxID=168475 RepID=UPI002545BC90|nr:uncharacterized protein N7495_003984 [Penicillium taxi]KAJ5899240.1 hypothetical protein N7495_003984 [Penicillium taxi]
MQGFNMGRYVPPDEEGVKSGNQLAGKHALGARARHLKTTGALIVRFEMPFAVWCTTCKPHEMIIGQGVRFNAEKKKIGNYFSTPIYSFRMKHTACEGWIEIRTDPKNTAYVVFEGGRKRDTGDDKELQPGEIAIRPSVLGQDPAEKDPFAKTEKKLDDKKRARLESSRIEELQDRQDRDWDDPYAQSKRLRRTFRETRKGLERLDETREALKDKMSLGIDIVDETAEDRQRAQMIEFGNDEALAASQSRAILSRPIFEQAKHRDEKPRVHLNKADQKREEHKHALQTQILGSNQARFVTDDYWKPRPKKKKISQLKSAPSDSVVDSIEPVVAPPTLVPYGSDSD